MATSKANLRKCAVCLNEFYVMFPIRYKWQFYERWDADYNLEEFYFCCEDCYEIFREDEGYEDIDAMEID